jgi:hypothetical protein
LNPCSNYRLRGSALNGRRGEKGPILLTFFNSHAK